MESRCLVFVYTSPGHDFPQRIRYRLRGDTLEATVDGVVGNITKTRRWTMRR